MLELKESLNETGDVPARASNEAPNAVELSDVGDFFFSAEPIVIPEFVDGDVGFGFDSADYYRFLAPVSGTVSISLSGLTDDVDLYLYNAFTLQIDSSTNFSTFSESIFSNVTGGAAYYVEVDPFLFAASDYRLIIDFTPGPDLAGNFLSTAASIGVNFVYSDSVGYGDDANDFGVFTAPADGTLTATLTDLYDDIDLGLYDASGELLEASTNAGSADEQIVFELQEGETYYLRATPYEDAASDYTAILSFEEADTTVGESIDNAGNSISTATGVNLPAVLEGTIGFGNDSNDVFSFTASSTGTLQLNLTDITEDIDLFLYDSNGTQIASSIKSGSQAESLSSDVTAGTTYYVQVFPYLSAQSTYRLSANIDSSAGSDAGNTLGNAASISIPSSFTGSVGFGSDTNDYFRFIAPADGDLSLTLSGLNADLDLVLYDNNGSILAAPFIDGAGDETINVELEAGQLYYARVTPYEDAASSYTLSLDFNATGSGINEEDDGNNTFSTPKIITLPFAISDSTGFGNDTEDYFSFVADQDGVATIELSNINADLDIHLYSEAGVRIDAPLLGSNQDEVIRAEVTAGETYIIGVTPWQNAESTYDLAVSIEASEEDTNGSIETAQTVGLPTEITGSVGFGTDLNDYYRFEVPENGTITLSLTGLEEDLDLYLYDESGALVASPFRGSIENEYIDQVVQEGEVYFVRVAQFAGSQSQYNLDVNFEQSQDLAGDSVDDALQVSLPSNRQEDVGFGSDAEDFYSFTAPNTGSLTATLSGLSANLDFRLLDADGTELSSSSSAGTEDENITYELTVGSLYYVSVVPVSDAESSYNLSLGFSEPESSSGTISGIPDDEYFSFQWHLQNTGQTGGTPGVDLDVVNVWFDYTGAGVTVGVYDTGVQYDHPDLVANYSTALHIAGFSGPHDPYVSSGEAHGTAVAGIIAATAHNAIGVVGVAYGATLGAVWLIDNDTPDFDRVDAIAQQTIYDVTNHSWGFTQDFVDNLTKSEDWGGFFSALETAALEGRDGLGTVMAVAAGNGRNDNSSANYSNFTNSPYVIAVAAADDNGNVASYSSPGANVLVTAFGGNYFQSTGDTIVTTDFTGPAGFATDIPSASLGDGDFTKGMNGTSAATPMVAGVVALMLDANPDLSYRDVQNILVNAARQTGGSGAFERYDWATNGADTWNGGGFHFSNDYGFGLVSGHDAVRLAETWFGNRGEPSIADRAPNIFTQLFTRAEGVTTGNDTVISFIPSADLFTRQTELSITLNATDLSGVKISLTSPSGMESVLFDGANLNITDFDGAQEFKFTSNAFWGESTSGVWQLTVADPSGNGSDVLSSLAVTYWGDRGAGSANDPSAGDDTYVYTDEFSSLAILESSRTTLDDSGGYDIFNASAVTSSVTVDLSVGTATIGGRSLILTAGTTIEEVYTGDGNDVLVGSSASEVLSGGRGADNITGGAGSDVFVIDISGDGGDTVTDFTRSGSELDVIDATAFLRSVDYTGDDPINDGYIAIATSGSDTTISVDRDGADGTSFSSTVYMTLQGVTTAELGNSSEWLVMS